MDDLKLTEKLESVVEFVEIQIDDIGQCPADGLTIRQAQQIARASDAMQRQIVAIRRILADMAVA